MNKAIFKYTIIIYCMLSLIGCNTVSKVEQAPYKVTNKQTPFEYRQYPSLLVAEVEVHGERIQALNYGFRLLANYIFGENQVESKIDMTAPVISEPKNQKIAMTAPVGQSQTDNQNWTVRFYMPKIYTLENIPKPKDNRIKLAMTEPNQALTIVFSGRNTQNNMDRHSRKLRAFAQKNQLNLIGEPQYAFYNPPWTLPIWRRNEIMFTYE